LTTAGMNFVWPAAHTRQILASRKTV